MADDTTIPVRVRIVVGPSSDAPGGFVWFVGDENTALRDSDHAVWIKADVPLPPAIPAVIEPG